MSDAGSAGDAQLAERVTAAMLRDDAFSRWLGVELLEIAPHRCTLRMTVRDDMLNGFGVCHGGVTFSLADSALAFASNTHGRVTVSIENAIRYPAPVHAGDVLTATAEEAGTSGRLGYYTATVMKSDGTVVGLFTGTVYRTDRPHAV